MCVRCTYSTTTQVFVYTVHTVQQLGYVCTFTTTTQVCVYTVHTVQQLRYVCTLYLQYKDLLVIHVYKPQPICHKIKVSRVLPLKKKSAHLYVYTLHHIYVYIIESTVHLCVIYI